MSDDPLLLEFFHYHTWANQALLQACEALTPDQLAATVPGTYGTIERTLEHLVDTEAFYYQLLTGVRLPAPFQWADRPSAAQIRAYSLQVSAAVARAAGQARYDDVVRQHWQGQDSAFKAPALLIQLIVHGVEHRSNITTILSALGLPAPELDGWGYMWTHRDRLGA